MRVKCVLCDGIHQLQDDTLEAKRLRNRPIHTYMCPSCHSRITERTNSRIASGKFRLYRDKSVEEEW